MSIIVIGMDLAKNIFVVHGMNENGQMNSQTQDTPRSTIAAHR